MKIAMLGTRGVPATYGGVEHHVEQVGRRLVERGHQVTVFTQSEYAGEQPGGRIAEHLGMGVVTLPTVRAHGLEALAHSAMSTMHGLGHGHDVFHYHAVGPGLMAPLARMSSRTAIVQTVHGLDADRAKWGGGARQVLSLATWMSARVPDRTVTVSQTLADHYRTRYERDATYVPNGVNPKSSRAPREITERWGLRGQDYVLFVGRLVPEKCPDELIKAYRQLRTDQKLVIAGGSSHTDEYVAELERLAADDPRVILTGYVYGDVLDELFTNATVFVQPSALEGLPLTLLEAMGGGVPVVVSDIAPHLEIVGEDRPGARVFEQGDAESLRGAIRRALFWPSHERMSAVRLRDAVLGTYDWDACTDRLETVYVDAVEEVSRRRVRRGLAPHPAARTATTLTLTGPVRATRSRRSTERLSA
ncbi:MAG: hypothetical protein CMH83_11915 [Nocardioides sp.]|nr:hypothetical protein [Nocardioides sp.]